MSTLILKDPHNWLLEQLYNANKTDHETFRIYKCLARYIDDNRDFIGITEQITPTITRFKPLTDVADDCLFSVTFFSDYIRKRSRRRGAPGVRFYTNAGKSIDSPKIVNRALSILRIVFIFIRRGIISVLYR